VSAPVVEDVEIRGAVPAHRPSLRTLAGLHAGEPLDEHAVEEARLRLLGSGRVRAVEARLERGTRRGRVRVVFEVEERQTFSLDAVHLGSAKPTKLWGGVEVSDLDPFGAGFGVAAGVVSSGEQTGARLALAFPELHLRVAGVFVDGREPFVGPTGQRLGGVPVEDVPVPYRRAGGELGLTFDVSPLTRAEVRFRGEDVRADLPAGAEQIDPDEVARPFDFHLRDGRSVLLELGGGLTYDGRDDPARPRRGLRADLFARTGGGDYAYLAVQGGLEQHFGLWARHGLQLDAQAGVLVGDAPFFERFFVGDLHPYIPSRALGVNFARRRGPNLLDHGIREQRYETLAARVGAEYTIPLGAPDDPYPVDLFFGGALLGLGSPGDPPHDAPRPLPFDAAADAGLRFETDIGVVGISVSTLLELVGP
jgi:outer membrane protein assembly factor BamA